MAARAAPTARQQHHSARRAESLARLGRPRLGPVRPVANGECGTIIHGPRSTDQNISALLHTTPQESSRARAHVNGKSPKDLNSQQGPMHAKIGRCGGEMRKWHLAGRGRNPTSYKAEAPSTEPKPSQKPKPRNQGSSLRLHRHLLLQLVSHLSPYLSPSIRLVCRFVLCCIDHSCACVV